jgi:RimJ/RimL family protein N-acetyltransferase
MLSCMVILQTDRLTLSTLSADDASFILELVNTPNWLRYIGDRGVFTLEGAEDYIRQGPQKSYAQFGFGLWRVARKEDNAPLGVCGLLKRDTLDHPDIGFAFLPVFEGQGLAFESSQAVLAYAATTLQLTRVIAITTEENRRSLNLLNRLGLNFEKMISLPGHSHDFVLMGKNLSVEL